MAHDVFISYSNKDKPVADAACAALEASGIRCWIAPRDVTPGTDWGESIIDAINASRVMVLVYSANANESAQIKREVERAVNRGTVIIPFRVEDVPMSKSLEYFISTPHWLDALTPPLEQHLGYLSDTVQALLDRPTDGSPVVVRRRPLSNVPTKTSAAAGVVAVVLLAGVLTLVSRGGGGTASPSGSGVESGLDSRLVGTFNLQQDVGPFACAGTMAIQESAEYRTSITCRDEGTVRYLGRDLVKLDSPRLRAVPTGYLGDEVPSGTLMNENSLSTYDAYGGLAWTRQPGTPAPAPGAPMPAAGSWRSQSSFINFTWTYTLEIAPSGEYEITQRFDDTGVLTARAGTWATISSVRQPPFDGRYVPRQDGSVSMSSQLGSGTWTR